MLVWYMTHTIWLYTLFRVFLWIITLQIARFEKKENYESQVTNWELTVGFGRNIEKCINYTKCFSALLNFGFFIVVLEQQWSEPSLH